MRARKIAIIQHQKNEDEGFIRDWLTHKNIAFEHVYSWQNSTYPDVESVSGVIILGGEANVAQIPNLPWLQKEVTWLTKAIEMNIPCFGICLGAQILAHILGANINQLTVKEYGKQPLLLSDGFITTVQKLFVLQAHQYYFEIANHCTNIASSPLCQNQLFINKHMSVTGIQCHLEWSNEKFTELFPEHNLELLTESELQEAKNLLFKLLQQRFIEG